MMSTISFNKKLIVNSELCADSIGTLILSYFWVRFPNFHYPWFFVYLKKNMKKDTEIT